MVQARYCSSEWDSAGSIGEQRAHLFIYRIPSFWTKIGLFVIVAVFSIPPTLQLVRWTKQAHSHPEFLPSDEEVRRVQWWLRAEVIVVVFIPFLAAAMARGVALS